MASLGFRGDVSYDHWSFNGLVGSTGSNGSVHALGVAANALVRTTSPTSVIHPYLIGGVGFYNTKASYGSLASSGNTNIGVQGGGGAEFMLSGFTTFAEVKVVNIFSKSSNGDGSSSTRFVPLTFGVRF